MILTSRKKLPLIYIDISLQKIFQNPKHCRYTPRSSVVNTARERAEISLEFVYVTRQVFMFAGV